MTWYQGISYDFSYFSFIDWIPVNYTIHPNAGDKFIVQNSSTLGCKLTVTSVQKSDPGDFKCEFQNSTEGTAKLYVFSKLSL